MDYAGVAWLDPTSIQDVTASNMTMHGRGCGHTSMELRVVASPNASNNYNNLFIQPLNCSSLALVIRSSDFIVRFVNCMLNI